MGFLRSKVLPIYVLAYLRPQLFPTSGGAKSIRTSLELFTFLQRAISSM